jgi:L,D-transpeptidase YcbB
MTFVSLRAPIPWRAAFFQFLPVVGAVLMLVALSNAASGQTGPRISAFQQAVAEAASEDARVAAFYRARNFAPVWTSAEDAERRRSFVSALSRAGDHGLPPARYDLSGLTADFHAVTSERDRGRLEVRMTRAFLRFAEDLHSGVLDPGQVSDNIKRVAPVLDAGAVLERLTRTSPAAVLRGVMPTAPEYARLVHARMTLQRQIERGGWGPAVPGGALRPGDSGEAVIALRNRLTAMGYLQRSAAVSYDAALQIAVQQFQVRHDLEADGIAGEATLRAINVSPEARLRSVVVALERERWMNIPRGERHIWVNLTDFSTRIVDRDRITFETTSIIGQRDRALQTPEFSEKMTYMEINPDWTIPRSIIGRSYLGALQANPYAHGQLQVIDSYGRVVDRSQIDFAAYSARNLPFNLRQPPGPSNPLGKVKFMFPNPHAIYLHDTPERSLFNTRVKAHSNGCVRLKDPEEFAYMLLERQVDDPVDHFHRIHRSGQQTRVYLDDPVPVHLVYRTAFTDVRGDMNFRDDVYGRDAAIFEELQRAGVEMPDVSS